MFFNRRGQAFGDLLVIILFAFLIGLTVILGKTVLNDLNDEIQADDDLGAEAKKASNTINDNYAPLFDKVFLFFIIMFWIFLLVSSFLIDTHPIFFIITVLLLVFVFIVGMIMSNTYEELTEDEDLATFADEFPITNWVMGNFLIVLIIIGFSTALALYAKNKL